jgi:hypothetical protein
MIKKIDNLIKKFFYRRKIIIHNKKIFNRNNNKKKIILIEFNRWSYLHIVKSYLGKVLSRKYNAKLVAFENYTLISDRLIKNQIKLFLRKILIILSIGTYGVYKSFGITEFLYPKISKKNEFTNKVIINYYLRKINSKDKLMKMKVKNIYVGDLIYDSYLKIYKVPTIDVNSNLFKNFLKESIILFLWWYKYIKKNRSQIKSLIIIHSVYLFGLQTRICNYFNIISYKPSYKSIIRINRNNVYPFKDVNYNTHYLKKIRNKDSIYRYSKHEIKNIIQGKSSVSKNYSQKIKNKLKLKNKNDNIKVLVVCHSFFDAPHSYGRFFKNDFYEWLCLLGEISNVTDYIWLIKPHPITHDQDLFFLEEIIKRYPKFQLIDKKYTNQEILNVGIDFALTCFGSVSFEYPFQGVKVINFSQNHPYKKFKFSYTPKNLNHYLRILYNLKKFSYSFKKNKIFDYYYIKRFILNVDYMELELDKNKDLDGYHLKENLFREEFYNRWLNSWTLQKHERVLGNIENFINSKDPYMSFYNIINKN